MQRINRIGVARLCGGSTRSVAEQHNNINSRRAMSERENKSEIESECRYPRIETKALSKPTRKEILSDDINTIIDIPRKLAYEKTKENNRSGGRMIEGEFGDVLECVIEGELGDVLECVNVSAEPNGVMVYRFRPVEQGKDTP
jgi:hypothetical protein